MYELYEPSEQIFVNREEYLQWMENALSHCSDKSIVLHLRGIGGIGKSSLVEHWSVSIKDSIVLDCDRFDSIYSRLDTLAKRAVRLGFGLRRFDILWHIRQRFIIGVEPAAEKGRQWAKDLLGPIPFIGSLASIGSAISTVGAKIAGRMTERMGDVGSWLQNRLGKDYIEKLLEILWKDPRHAEFLYLDALLEDLNHRNTLDKPILVMLDQFEVVESEALRWRYGGKAISEAELWYIFLSNITNSVGVVASRRPLPAAIESGYNVKELELSELDEESSKELLSLRGCSDFKFQERAYNISRGHPFVMSSICDLTNFCSTSLVNTDDLDAETLDEVNVKVWRRLFSEAGDLLDIIDRAGLVPFFDQNILNIIAPSMKSEHWDRITKLSFVKRRENGTWILHDLARNLVITELGERAVLLVDEVATSLEKVFEKEGACHLLGMAVSARAIASEDDAIQRVTDKVEELSSSLKHDDTLDYLSAVEFNFQLGKGTLSLLRGKTLFALSRIADGEHELLDALAIFKTLAEDSPEENLGRIASTFDALANLYRDSNRPTEAEESYNEAAEIWRKLAQMKPLAYNEFLAATLRELTWLLYKTSRTQEGEQTIREVLQIYQMLTDTSDKGYQSETARCYLMLGACLEGHGTPSKYEHAYNKALTIYRNLAKDNPDQFLSFVAAALNNVALSYQTTNRHSEAETAFRETVEIRRKVSKNASSGYQSRIAIALINLAWLLYEMHKLQESEEAFKEAQQIFIDLSRDDPKLNRGGIAGAKMGLARISSDIGKHKLAEETQRDAISLYVELNDETPELHRHQYAWSLGQLGLILKRMGQLEGAEPAFRESLEIIRDCAEQTPDAFRSKVCITNLGNLAILLRHKDKVDEAEALFQEAIEMLRNRSKKAPEVYSKTIAITLNNWALLLTQLDRPEEAENTFREALAIARELAKKEPLVFSHYLAIILSNLTLFLKSVSRTKEADKTGMESKGIWERIRIEIPELPLSINLEDEQDLEV